MIWFLPQISWWWLLGFLLLVAPHPGASWYKHSASPRYHTVGRASGLLIGVRRSPYLWRRDLASDRFSGGKLEDQEGAEGVYGLLEEPDTGHLLYPGPDEVGDVKEEGFQWKTGREVEERKVEEMIKGLQEHEKERSILDEVKRQVQVPEEDKNLETLMRFPVPGEEERSIEEVRRGLKVPWDPETYLNKATSIKRSKLSEEPGRIIDDSLIRLKNSGDPIMNLEEVKKRIQASGEWNWSPQVIFPQENEFHHQEGSRTRPKPWRRQTWTETQNPRSSSVEKETLDCEDFTLTLYKVLCKASLRIIFQQRSRRQRPATDGPGSTL